MSKAYLIMDMPSSCGSCPCCYEGAHDICNLKGKSVLIQGKPEWCPLRELPQKMRNSATYETTSKANFARGWNKCIDEIMKGSETE